MESTGRHGCGDQGGARRLTRLAGRLCGWKAEMLQSLRKSRGSWQGAHAAAGQGAENMAVEASTLKVGSTRNIGLGIGGRPLWGRVAVWQCGSVVDW